jgi:hypothetical protein
MNQSLELNLIFILVILDPKPLRHVHIATQSFEGRVLA